MHRVDNNISLYFSDVMDTVDHSTFPRTDRSAMNLKVGEVTKGNHAWRPTVVTLQYFSLFVLSILASFLDCW